MFDTDTLSCNANLISDVCNIQPKSKWNINYNSLNYLKQKHIKLAERWQSYFFGRFDFGLNEQKTFLLKLKQNKTGWNQFISEAKLAGLRFTKLYYHSFLY